MRLGPGKLLGLSNDGAESDPDTGAIFPAGLFGFGVDAIDLIFGLLQGLTPKTKDVGERASNAVCLIRRPAYGDGNGLVGRDDVAVELFELEVGSFPVKGFLGFPSATQNFNVFFQATIYQGSLVCSPRALGS